MTTFSTFAIVEEADRAHARYGDFTSTHEALGVLREEFREIEDAIRANSMQATAREALQIAAVALRLHEICERAMVGKALAFKERSGA